MWQRWPSVTYGGKEAFITGVFAGRRYWICWDRYNNKYVVSREEYDTKTGCIDTEKAGKEFVEELLSKQCIVISNDQL